MLVDGKRPMRTSCCLAILASFAAIVPALGQTAAEQAECKADYEKFCEGVVPGGGRIVKCLGEHIDQLSPQCQRIVTENAPK